MDNFAFLLALESKLLLYRCTIVSRLGILVLCDLGYFSIYSVHHRIKGHLPSGLMTFSSTGCGDKRNKFSPVKPNTIPGIVPFFKTIASE